MFTTPTAVDLQVPEECAMAFKELGGGKNAAYTTIRWQPKFRNESFWTGGLTSLSEKAYCTITCIYHEKRERCRRISSGCRNAAKTFKKTILRTR